MHSLKQLSEQLGLVHTSQGQEPDRYVEVKKLTLHETTVSDVALQLEAASLQATEEEKSSNSEEDPGLEDATQISEEDPGLEDTTISSKRVKYFLSSFCQLVTWVACYQWSTFPLCSA